MEFLKIQLKEQEQSLKEIHELKGEVKYLREKTAVDAQKNEGLEEIHEMLLDSDRQRGEVVRELERQQDLVRKGYVFINAKYRFCAMMVVMRYNRCWFRFW